REAAPGTFRSSRSCPASSRARSSPPTRLHRERADPGNKAPLPGAAAPRRARPRGPLRRQEPARPAAYPTNEESRGRFREPPQNRAHPEPCPPRSRGAPDRSRDEALRARREPCAAPPRPLLLVEHPIVRNEIDLPVGRNRIVPVLVRVGDERRCLLEKVARVKLKD